MPCPGGAASSRPSATVAHDPPAQVPTCSAARVFGVFPFLGQSTSNPQSAWSKEDSDVFLEASSVNPSSWGFPLIRPLRLPPIWFLLRYIQSPTVQVIEA